MPSDDAVDELYALPLDQFVTRRNALAKELRAAGDKEAATEVAALRKPTVPAWVVNQLARTAPDEVEALLDAGRQVAAAQAGALRGAGSAPLREAAAAERAALRAVLARARPLIRTDAVRNRVAGALRAAAADPSIAEQVRSGRLTDEPEAPAFGGLASVDGGVAVGRTPVADSEDAEAGELAAERREPERRAAELARRAEKAEREAERLEQRADAAEREARERRQAADLAREEAAALRQAAEETPGPG